MSTTVLTLTRLYLRLQEPWVVEELATLGQNLGHWNDPRSQKTVAWIHERLAEGDVQYTHFQELTEILLERLTFPRHQSVTEVIRFAAKVVLSEEVPEESMSDVEQLAVIVEEINRRISEVAAENFQTSCAEIRTQAEQERHTIHQKWDDEQKAHEARLQKIDEEHAEFIQQSNTRVATMKEQIAQQEATSAQLQGEIGDAHQRVAALHARLGQPLADDALVRDYYAWRRRR